MATIHIDNLINPRQVNSKATVLTQPNKPTVAVYTDLHLDLSEIYNIGIGTNPQKSNDIKVDNDAAAIKNSLYNIFTTIPGQKILNPSFGCNLNQFVFEEVSEIKGKIIGDTILNAINVYEPRVQVLNIQVYPLPDQLMYYIIMSYQMVGIASTFSTQIQIFPNNILIV
jgi:hypothetical protein